MIKNKERKRHTAGTWMGLLVLLGVLIMISMMVGRFQIRPETLYLILTGHGNENTEASSAAAVLFEVRLARIAAAVLIGAGLSGAGAAFQGVFRNPLVSPDLLGAATGASFGAALAILMGANTFLIQASAFLFGLLAVGTAYVTSTFLSGKHGGSVITLILTGMVVSALFSAFISIVKYVGDPYDTLPVITFWLMGGLTYVTRSDLYVMLIPFAAGLIPLLALRWRLNVLSFDDEEASSLGMDVRRSRAVVILSATLVTSSTVAVGGMIGWVGLIVPHVARMLVGPDYSRMLPCSLLTGGIFLLLVDDLARSLFAQELPLGVLTAISGAPFFLYLMYRGRKSF